MKTDELLSDMMSSPWGDTQRSACEAAATVTDLYFLSRGKTLANRYQHITMTRPNTSQPALGSDVFALQVLCLNEQMTYYLVRYSHF